MTYHNIPIVHVTNNDQLSEAVSILKESKLMALDTEFDKMWTRFGMNLELIQIFDGRKVYLIRTCLIEDVTMLHSLLSDNHIIKVIYAAGEDIQALKSRGLFLQGLYDLQVASKLAGIESRSFVQLVTELLGIELSKKEQRSNWRAKNLSDGQIAYAANDVIYTLQLYSVVKDKILANKKEQILDEKNRAIEKVKLQTFKPKLKPNHKRQNKEVQRKILKLLELRAALAEKKDVPPFRIFSNELIDEIWTAGSTFECLSFFKHCPKPYQGNSPKINRINAQIRNILCCW